MKQQKIQDLLKFVDFVQKTFNSYLNNTALTTINKIFCLQIKYNNLFLKEKEIILKFKKFKSQTLLKKKTLTEKQFIELLFICFEIIKKIEESYIKNLQSVNLVYLDYDSWELKRTQEFPNSLVTNIETAIENKSIYDIILTGSFATNDYIQQWSDIDLISIVDLDYLTKENIKLLKRNIKEIDLEVFKICPLQHHTSMVLFRSTLNLYSESYFFPFFLFTRSISFCKNKKIKISYFETNNKKSREKLIKKEQYFKEIYKNKQPINNYQLKDIISSALNIPFTYLHAKKIYVDKKESFDKLKEYNTIKLETLSYWSNFRTSWPKLNNDRRKIKQIFFGQLLLNFSIKEIFYRFYFEKNNYLINRKTFQNKIIETIKLLKIMNNEIKNESDINKSNFGFKTKRL
ncbi:hypothetical protein HOC11_03045 [archaeon]|jgi:hypothetical protein|nr:hypothetical protein [archaeon]